MPENKDKIMNQKNKITPHQILDEVAKGAPETEVQNILV